MTDTLEKLELVYFKPGEQFHYITPGVEESIL
jgi:hypothetical protein